MSVRSIFVRRFDARGFAFCALVLGAACTDDEGPSKATAATASTATSASSAAATSTPPAASSSAVVASASAAPSAAVVYELTDLPEPDLVEKTLDEQRASMVRRMRAMHGLDDAQVASIEEILKSTKWMGQGNPDVVDHPMTRKECIERRRAADVKDVRSARCGAPFMVPAFDPATETEETAKVCVDRYEFPGMPCDYPLTWVTAKQAQGLCRAMGKRLCDAHEWEGACAGAVLPADKEYAFGRPRQTMQGLHNQNRAIRWAYGATKDHSICATGSKKSPKCTAPSWKGCGSNTYPSGAFPECKSPFGVYDLHGNVAEHMWLPREERELSSRGGKGVPEMKGSWFIWTQHEAHIDDCRWRAPSWHENEGDNHRSYHLGFRCCKDI